MRPVQRQVLDQHRQSVREDIPAGRHQTAPLRRREQQDVEHQAVEQPQHVDAQVPPAGQPDGVPDPGQANLPGRLMESCFAVHNGSAGTGFWIRNQSLPGVLCRVQYSRGWSLRIWIPDRMMKIMKNRLRKCCAATQPGRPTGGWEAPAVVPG